MTPIKTLPLLTVMLLALPASVRAEEHAQVRVSLIGADPATVEGRNLLRARARRAADEFCDDANERFGPNVVRAQRQCREAIVASVMARATPLSALWTRSAR